MAVSVDVDHTIIGATGVVIVATRGEDGPGEVSLRIGGASESYLARSAEPLARGVEVVVTDLRGPRTVEVESLEDLDEPVPSPATDPLLDL